MKKTRITKVNLIEETWRWMRNGTVDAARARRKPSRGIEATTFVAILVNIVSRREFMSGREVSVD